MLYLLITDIVINYKWVKMFLACYIGIPEEGFFRMANFQNHNIYKFYKSSQWRIADPTNHYIRALLPQYNNPNEYVEIAVRAVEVELVHMERISICNQVHGIINKSELVEYCEIDGVLAAVAVVDIKVPFSLFWSQAGLAKFDTKLLQLHRVSF